MATENKEIQTCANCYWSQFYSTGCKKKLCCTNISVPVTLRNATSRMSDRENLCGYWERESWQKHVFAEYRNDKSITETHALIMRERRKLRAI